MRQNAAAQLAYQTFLKCSSYREKRELSALVAELKACSISKDLNRGKAVHGAAIQCGHDSNILVANTLISMYAKCRRLKESREVFDGLQNRTVVSWTSLILGHADNGQSETALGLFARMRLEGYAADAKTFVAVLKACASLDDNLQRGEAVHLLLYHSGQIDTYVQNTLVDMYGKHGRMEDARSVFDSMQPDLISWNALLLGYAENGQGQVCLDLFARMLRESYPPDARTFVAITKACIDLATKEEGNEVRSVQRGRAVHLLSQCCGCCSDIYVKSTLVDMYAKCGYMHESLGVFESVDNPDVVFWSALIMGYAENGECTVALDVFARMASEGCAPNGRTFVAVLKACTELGEDNARQRGKAVHLVASCSGCDANAFVQNTLVRMYAKHKNMPQARTIFDGMKRPEVISWNAIILGYADERQGRTALELFFRMKSGGWTPDEKTIVAALRACVDVAVKEDETGKTEIRELGRALHLLALRNGQADLYVKSTLVDMYAKCGDIAEARNVFEAMENPTVVPWTALMIGYADHGEWHQVLHHFARMEIEGCEPDAFAFVAALRACGVKGALELGKCIHSEIRIRGLEQDMVLATCLVDLYTKCGNLAEAERVFSSQVTKDMVTWTALMTGYSRHGNTSGVFQLFDRMLESGLQPNSVTLLCVLSACNHAGLVAKGVEYFASMATKYGVQPDVEHYRCVMDLLGRANKLDDAMALVRSMPLAPTSQTWSTILGSCRKWKNVELGELVFDSLMRLGHADSGAYALMANLYQH